MNVFVVNPLASGKFECKFRYLIFQISSVIDGWVTSCELALRWMSLYLTDDKSTLVQVMNWCRQATSDYLSLCWLRSLSPYGVTRPQWVSIGTTAIHSKQGWCLLSYRAPKTKTSRHTQSEFTSDLWWCFKFEHAKSLWKSLGTLLNINNSADILAIKNDALMSI